MKQFWSLGPYEKAEHLFENQRNDELWIACLAHYDQDYKKAKSAYIKNIAKKIIIDQDNAKIIAEKKSIEAEIREEESRQYLEEQNLDFKEKLDKADEQSHEIPWLNGYVFAALSYFIGVLILSGLIGFSGWFKWVLVLILSVPYASLGFVLGGKLRCWFVPEFGIAYGEFYRFFGWIFVLSFIYVIIIYFII